MKPGREGADATKTLSSLTVQCSDETPLPLAGIGWEPNLALWLTKSLLGDSWSARYLADFFVNTLCPILDWTVSDTVQGSPTSYCNYSNCNYACLATFWPDVFFFFSFNPKCLTKYKDFWLLSVQPTSISLISSPPKWTQLAQQPPISLSPTTEQVGVVIFTWNTFERTWYFWKCC